MRWFAIGRPLDSLIMEWAIAILVIAVLGGAAIVAAGGVGEMSRNPVRDGYRQDLPDRALTAADLQELRFGITVRGYAMDQVDDVLARLSHEIAERDALIAQLVPASGPQSTPQSTTQSTPEQISEQVPESNRQPTDNAPVTTSTPAGGKVSG